jgi:hypothetical protein
MALTVAQDPSVVTGRAPQYLRRNPSKYGPLEVLDTHNPPSSPSWS